MISIGRLDVGKSNFFLEGISGKQEKGQKERLRKTIIKSFCLSIDFLGVEYLVFRSIIDGKGLPTIVSKAGYFHRTVVKRLIFGVLIYFLPVSEQKVSD